MKLLFGRHKMNTEWVSKSGVVLIRISFSNPRDWPSANNS